MTQGKLAIANKEKISTIKISSSETLNKAGPDIIRACNKVLTPLAFLTNRKTLEILSRRNKRIKPEGKLSEVKMDSSSMLRKVVASMIRSKTDQAFLKK